MTHENDFISLLYQVRQCFCIRSHYLNGGDLHQGLYAAPCSLKVACKEVTRSDLQVIQYESQQSKTDFNKVADYGTILAALWTWEPASNVSVGGQHSQDSSPYVYLASGS